MSPHDPTDTPLPHYSSASWCHHTAVPNSDWTTISRQLVQFLVGDILKSIQGLPLSATSWQNQQNGMCTQRRLRSAWASAQSDQSLCSAFHGKLRIQPFFMRTARTLIGLGGCPVWSESSFGAQIILLVLSQGGSLWSWVFGHKGLGKQYRPRSGCQTERN